MEKTRVFLVGAGFIAIQEAKEQVADRVFFIIVSGARPVLGFVIGEDPRGRTFSKDKNQRPAVSAGSGVRDLPEKAHSAIRSTGPVACPNLPVGRYWRATAARTTVRPPGLDVACT